MKYTVIRHDELMDTPDKCNFAVGILIGFDWNKNWFDYSVVNPFENNKKKIRKLQFCSY